MGGPIPGAKGDPLPAPPVSENVWATIDLDHRLVHLDDDLVLDWAPSGDFRMYRFDRSARNGADPLPGPPLTQGTWTTIGAQDQIVYLGRDRVLVWRPGTGRFRVWLLDRDARGGSDPLRGDVPQTDGVWTSTGVDHQLIPLGGGRVLDWHAPTGGYRVWRHDPFAVGAADPLPGPPLAQGTWATIGPGHELVSFGADRVLVRHIATGGHRFWQVDPTSTGDPFPGDPVVSGTWTGIATGHRLTYLGGDRVLDLQAGGRFRVWRFDREITTLRRATVRVHLRILVTPRHTPVQTLVDNIVALYGSYGFDVVIASRTSLVGDDSLAGLHYVDIGECRRSFGATEQQAELFAKVGDGVPRTDILACVVRGLIEPKAGCASHPVDRPALVIGGDEAQPWTLAHEVGHVLGLVDHPTDRNRLMYWTTAAITDEPPDFRPDEIATMLASPLSRM